MTNPEHMLHDFLLVIPLVEARPTKTQLPLDFKLRYLTIFETHYLLVT